MDTIEAHWNTRSPDYNDFVVKGFSDLRERRAWQEHFTSIFGDEPLNVLDVGCGPGIVSMQLADLGHRVTSVDISDSMLDFARRNAEDNGLDIEFMKCDAHELCFDDCSFDAVVSDYMLWTVPGPERVMSEWFRVLKPGCRLAYTDGDWFHDPRCTPYRCRISSTFKYIDHRGRTKSDTDDMDLELWSSSAQRPRDDIRMMEKAGFRDVSVIHDVQRKVLRGIRYYAYGYTNDHFTVTGVKPE